MTDAGASEPDQPTRESPGEIPGQRLRVLGVDPEMGFAGGESQVLALTLELLRAGHHAELACDTRGALFERARGAGVRCHPLSIRNAVDFAAAMRLRALLAREHYDIVHFHTSRAHGMAPMVRGCARAMVVTRRMDYRPNRIFAPFLYNRAVDAVAAISKPVADALIESGVARDHVTIVPSGVDCDRFRPPTAGEREQARTRLAISPAELAIGTVGMLEERKGHRYLLEAMASLPGSRPLSRQPINLEAAASAKLCLIAGEGSLRDELSRRAAELGIASRIRMLGMLADSRAVLDALDIFVFPSLKEGLGVAMLEAMACGLAVVASRAGGIAEVIDDGRSGILVPPADSGAIADALARLAADPASRSTLGAAARERVLGDFSTGAMARKTIELYRLCLSRRTVDGGSGNSGRE